MTLRYRVDGREFLDRRRRALAIMNRLTSGEPFDARTMTADWSAVVSEIGEIAFEEGRRYRIRVVAGEAGAKHVHVREEETGKIFGLDLPTENDPGFRELEATFLGRTARLPAGGSSFLVVLDNGQTALLGDIDVIEADEIPS